MDIEEQEGNSLASALSDAWDQHDAGGIDDGGDAGVVTDTGVDDGVDDGAADDGADEGAGGRGASGRDSSGRFTAGDGDAGRDPSGQETDPAGVPGADTETQGTEGSGANERAPVSWNATARETWANIPAEAQAYIHQREQEFERGIQQYSANAQRAEAMDQVLQPYSQYFAMNGGAGETIKTLLATGAGLQMGSPVQKAQMVAGIIQQYGIDIGTLDNLLVGKQPGQQVQQQSEVQQAVAQALQPFQQFIQGQQQAQQQQQQQFEQQSRDAVTQFASDPKNEFYNDVAADMADILDMAANRGIEMDLSTAYQRACQMNPEVSKILQNRAAAQDAANSRRADVSLPAGGRGGEQQQQPPGSLSEAISRAWDAVENQGGQI